MKIDVIKTTVKQLLYDNYYAVKKADRIAKLYYSNFIHSLNSRERETVIVYQMGKVGSTTIYDSLRNLKNMDVYHVHTLTKNGIEKGDTMYKNDFYRTRSIPSNQLESQYLREQLDKGLEGKKKWKVVALVRDPIARNISSFFQKLDFFVGYDYKVKSNSMKMEDIMEDLTQLFLEKFNRHEKPLRWFDGELKRVFDIDVFSSNFPTVKGYKTYEARYADLLVLRLENLNECACGALENFLDINEFTLTKSNVGSNKRYGNIYQKFIDSIVLPESYINQMYTSKYVRHFYNEEETEAFKAKWCRQNHT